MDKFFTAEHDIPVLQIAELDRMTEVALSYRQQQAPVNQNGRFGMLGGMFWNWRAAFSGAACIALVIGVLAMQDVTPAGTSVASADDAYSDITEIAILNTIDGY